MEALVFTDGAVTVSAKAFCEVLKTYKGTRVLVFEGGADGLRVQNFRMPVLAYNPAPKPPGDFQVFYTSAPPGTSTKTARESSVASGKSSSEMPAAPLVSAEGPPTSPVDLDALMLEAKRLYCSIAKGNKFCGKEITLEDIQALNFRLDSGLSPKQGMRDDDIKAFALFCRAASAGHSEAQYIVSRCYHWGHGVQEDYRKEFYWLRKAAESGFAEANAALEKKIAAIHRVALQMREELDREPTDEELAEEVGLSAEDVSQFRDESENHVEATTEPPKAEAPATTPKPAPGELSAGVLPLMTKEERRSAEGMAEDRLDAAMRGNSGNPSSGSANRWNCIANNTATFGAN
jgi:hypothetical protein